MTAAKKAASSRSDASSSKKALRVSAPLVQVQIGSQVLHLFDGDFVPEGVSKEKLDHLKELGYVTEGDVANEPDEN